MGMCPFPWASASFKDMPDINSISIKISGRTELEEDIKAGFQTTIMMPIDVYSTEYKDQHDGFHDKIYKAKCNGSVQVAQGDKLIRGKDKNKTSKKNRDFVWIQGEGYNVVDHPQFYEDFYQVLRANPEISDLIISKLDIDKYR